eukprot:366166-Chlamydomonas_euryale.AAC.12
MPVPPSLVSETPLAQTCLCAGTVRAGAGAAAVHAHQRATAAVCMALDTPALWHTRRGVLDFRFISDLQHHERHDFASGTSILDDEEPLPSASERCSGRPHLARPRSAEVRLAAQRVLPLKEAALMDPFQRAAARHAQRSECARVGRRTWACVSARGMLVSGELQHAQARHVHRTGQHTARAGPKHRRPEAVTPFRRSCRRCGAAARERRRRTPRMRSPAAAWRHQVAPGIVVAARPAQPAHRGALIADAAVASGDNRITAAR